MAPHSIARYARVWDAFLRYAAARGERELGAAPASLCSAFIYAPQRNGKQPAAATSRFRLTVVRDGFHILHSAGAAASDPTLGLQVQQRYQGRVPVPLTPAEFARLRSAGRTFPRDHIRPAITELAALGGSHAEIAAVVVADVALAESRVRLGDRWGDLEPFAHSTLAARVAECRLQVARRGAPWDPSSASVAMPRPYSSYPESSIAPGISSSISRAMRSAGLARPGLRPASIREFAANRVYAQTDRVEAVASLLGISSLDAAMTFVVPAWQEAYRDEVREH